MDLDSYQWGEAFQHRLLALLIKDAEHSHELIQPEYFTNPILAEIAKVVQETYERIDPKQIHLSKTTLRALVKANLGKKKKEIWPLCREAIRRVYRDKLRDKEVLRGQALDFSRERRYQEALVLMERDISNKKFDVAHRRFEELRNFGRDPDVGVDYWENLRSTDRYRDDRNNICPTGWNRMDRKMGGGMGGGELGIILGPGKRGKTTSLVNIAVGCLHRNKSVAIATAELSEKKYRKRIDSLLSGVPAHKLFKLRKKVRRRLKIARRLMTANLYIKQFPTGKGSTVDIEAWLGRLEENDIHIDVLLVDYIFLFQPRFRVKERRFNIGQVAVELRGIAVERDIPVWTASQGNRKAMLKEIVGPEDFAEDISQFWTLDFLIAICQTKVEKDMEPPQARLFLAAARDLESGYVDPIKVLASTYKMVEIEEGHDDDDD